MVGFTIPNEADAFHADQAEPDKVDFDILVAGVVGDGVISGCVISERAAGANLSVDFASGEVKIGGSPAEVTSGNIVVTAADATDPRFDLAVVNSSGTKSITAGTAASNPVFPSIPVNSIVLAAIYIPANDTTIADNQITDKRVMLKPTSVSLIFTFPAVDLGIGDFLPLSAIKVPTGIATDGIWRNAYGSVRCAVVGSGGGANTMRVKESSTLTGARTLINTFNLSSNREFGALLDPAWKPTGYIWIECSAVGTTPPQRAMFQLDFESY